MAMAVNLVLMVFALALVGYPLLRYKEQPEPVQAAKLQQVADSVEAALAEAELDQALGKVNAEDYRTMQKRLGSGIQKK